MGSKNTLESARDVIRRQQSNGRLPNSPRSRLTVLTRPPSPAVTVTQHPPKPRAVDLDATLCPGCSGRGCQQCDGSGRVCPACRGMRVVRVSSQFRANWHYRDGSRCDTALPEGLNTVQLTRCAVCTEGNNVNADKEAAAIQRYHEARR